MNSPNQQPTFFELQLRRDLKQWLTRATPPVEARQQLLAAAAQKPAWREGWFLLLMNSVFNREYSASSFDRFAHATAYSLQMGVLIL